MIKAANIKLFRFTLGIRVGDMAKFLGISQSLLSMIESSERAVPSEVDKRIAWSGQLIKEADKAFDKEVKKNTFSNENSIRYAWKVLASKKSVLEVTEMKHAIMLRENIEFTRKIYLLQRLRPTPGLKAKQLSIYEAWKKYMVRLAEGKMEAAGPEVILKSEMKIAALRSEIQCIEKHLGLNSGKQKQSGKKGAVVKN